MIKIKVSKNKTVVEKKKVIKEGVILLLVGLIVGALGAFFSKYMMYLKQFGADFDAADKKTKEAAGSLPEPIKTEFLQSYETAMEEFKKEAEKIKKESAATDKSAAAKAKLRPTQRLSEKIKPVLAAIEQVQTKYAEELKKYPEAVAKMNEGKKEMLLVFKKIANLDIFAAIASKEDPNGLWKKIQGTPVEAKFKDDKQWLEFAGLLSTGATIKTKKLPAGLKQPAASA